LPEEKTAKKPGNTTNPFPSPKKNKKKKKDVPPHGLFDEKRKKGKVAPEEGRGQQATLKKSWAI